MDRPKTLFGAGIDVVYSVHMVAERGGRYSLLGALQAHYCLSVGVKDELGPLEARGVQDLLETG